MGTVLDERYGRRPSARRRRLLVMAAAVAGAVALAWLGWVAVAGPAPVRWDDVGYRVLSDAAVEVTFDVTVDDADGRAVCTVHALNALYTEIGLRDVPVRAGAGGRVRVTATVRTSEPAVTGLVRSCTAA